MGVYGDRIQTQTRSERRSGSFSHKRILSIGVDSITTQKRSKSALLYEFIAAHKELEIYKYVHSLFQISLSFIVSRSGVENLSRSMGAHYRYPQLPQPLASMHLSF